MEELAEADTAPHTRFNDGKCDSSGRFWCGTMAIDTSVGDQGAFYSFAKGEEHTRPLNHQPLPSLVTCEQPLP